jgi:hypothetical protein
MLKDGKYAAWFRTSRGEGTGIVLLANGKISGGDSMFAYSGSYQVDDDRITATLTTRRHAAGPPTVFGIDEVDVKLTGRFQWHDGFVLRNSRTGAGRGLRGNAFPRPDQSLSQIGSAQPVKFDAGKRTAEVSDPGQVDVQATQ